MSIAGASGDRWAIRTHPSCAAAAAAGAADAAADVAATAAAVLPRSAVIIASRARCESSRIVTYLFVPHAVLSATAIGDSRAHMMTSVNRYD